MVPPLSNPNEEKVPDGVSMQVDLAKHSYLALAKVIDLLRSENDVTQLLISEQLEPCPLRHLFR